MNSCIKLDEVSSFIYNEMLNKSYWDITLRKLEEKGKVTGDTLGLLYTLKETGEYKSITRDVCQGTYNWGIPDKLELRKDGGSKKRVVYMYPEVSRYIMGVLYRVLSKLYADRVADNCFSYKRGTNTCDAIHYIRDSKQDASLFGVKLDIHAYFNSVSRDRLNFCLTELFGDSSGIRNSLDAIFNDDTVNLYGKEIKEYKSLVPGCALGSFFANYCLRNIDQHFKDIGVVYARYSDDILVFGATKELIEEYLDFIKERIFSYGLTINESKYVHFNPGDAVDYLGLVLSSDGIDISSHAKMKLKRTIKRWAKEARKDIELNGSDFDKVAKKFVNRLNWKLYKSYIKDTSKFGWAFYAFRYITVLDSLTDIDFYLRDRLRYLKTGKNNKANVYALSEEDFRNLGVLSLYDMYNLFHNDFDYYCEVIYLV